MRSIYQDGEISAMANKLFEQERSHMRLDGWFLAKEIACNIEEQFNAFQGEVRGAYVLREIIQHIPLSISEHAVFVGTQRDAFARSYALINPSFKVEEFSGYCDPTAVYDDIAPNTEFTRPRIDHVKEYVRQTPFVRELCKVYNEIENYTKEVVFFVEQVTGHLVPDFRPVLNHGLDHIIKACAEKEGETFRAMEIALSCVKILISRYIKIAKEQKDTATSTRKKQLDFMIGSLERISTKGATNLYEAMQLYMLLWQMMCMEQAPNPFAFSVGNADRIFEPYRNDWRRETTAELFKHFLVFFHVGDRGWAISQNIIVSGKDCDGKDLTNETSYALLDAYYDMNLPQPILSIKLHQNTPDELYRALGKFFFSPGVLTPSLFNDDSMFVVLEKAGIDKTDLPHYAIAGCQEPLIMGKDNGNTTNSWLSLPKILELTLTGGKSLISGEQLVNIKACDLADMRNAFYQNVDMVLDEMVRAANSAMVALSNLKVPFLSAFMGGLEYGADMRSTKKQGTKYSGSGCLIHGLSVVADSFIAIDHLLSRRPEDKDTLVQALENNFVGYAALHAFLRSCPKFGNNMEEVDNEAAHLAGKIADMVRSKKNALGRPFRPDFSSPSTHLLYGYWVGATPDGRLAREMLGYGVDPLYGESGGGMGFRMLSTMKLPFEKFCGGYASHFGIDPKYFTGSTFEEKGLEFKNKIITPLFFNQQNKHLAPFYLYVNVTTPETLRKLLANPKKYAPSGVYIMRIHGTFVNFLDLSDAIQQDIIKRLDLASTKMEG